MIRHINVHKQLMDSQHGSKNGKYTKT